MTETQTSGPWCFYDGKGEIHARGYMSEAEALDNAVQYALAPLPALGDELTQYVLNGELANKQPLRAALVGSSIKGVPSGASVTIEGVDYIADGSDIELEFSHVGTYKINISLFPWLDTELTYENQTRS